MNKAVFLDRDGTINIDKEYLYEISKFEFISGVKEAMLLLQDAGYLLIIITNQSGVARGYYSEKDVSKLNNWLKQALAEEGIIVSEIYYCPHHPEGEKKEYKKDCDCRKPRLGMFKKAINDFNIDINKSFVIGDKIRDLQICKTSNCKGYLLDNKGTSQYLSSNVKIAFDLKEAAIDILNLT